jgi:DNA invertase Pin-like site-specific DNA recombinase
MHVCQDFCKRHNIRIVEMYIDRATSASKDIEKRVEFLKMIKDSEKGNFNAVIVYKLDRFARSRYDSATYKYRLKRNGVQLISATENITQDPEGIILESVLEGMAEFYSAELSQKINRGMRESALKHNSIGGAIPLGYKTVDKKLVIDETTAPIVREAFQMYADGESVAEICRTFNNRGYKTSKGTRFGKSSFTKIFRNEKYIGVYKYHDYRAEDVIPPIIDKDLWDRVQVRVGKIKKAPARNKARHTYLLTGKLFCGHCGSAMNADGNSQGYLYYRCYGKKNLDKQCNKRNMEKNLIERLVAQDAMSFLTDEYIEKIATIACDRNKQEIESDSPIPVIRDRIRQVDVSLNNLLKAIETGSAPDMLVKRMGELETEKKDMEVQLKKEMAHQVYIDKEQVIFWLEKFREGDINDEEFCQTVIDLFVNSVTVWDEPDDKFKITIAYNLTSIPQKTYRLSKDGRLSDYASNTPPLSANPMILGSLMIHTFTVTVHPQKRGKKTV